MRRFANFGSGSLFDGVLAGDDNYIVYGTVKGDGDLRGSLVLKEGSHWKGNIKATHVIIAGEVHGDVTGLVKVELLPTAHVHGAVSGPLIAVAEGAVHGRIRTSKKTRVVRYTERRGSTAKPTQERGAS